MGDNKNHEYLNRVAEALQKTDSAVLTDIARRIIETKAAGKRIFTAGNGGSAATASHFCNDLVKGCRIDGRTGFKAQCLCDPMPVLTCLANDFSYEEAFSIELQTQAEPGDVLVVFSGSGNSPDILRAAEFARARGMFVIGFGGRDGGKMKSLCQLFVMAPTWSMEELEDLHLCYCHALVTSIREELMDVWDIEVINYPVNHVFRCALFDFDGTVSLLREGWRDVMIPYFVETLAETASSPDMEEITETVTEFVDLLTGRQTIFQCMQLGEEVQKRGGEPLSPHLYKKEYLHRLMARIQNRHEALRKGEAKPSDYLAPGCEAFLTLLRQCGLKLYLASGTDEADVRAEAELLGISGYFDGGIYGAEDTVKDCSKELVIRRIVAENGIDGTQLVSFGDGYVEVQLVKDIGGYAVAVATDEKRRKGVNAWKRQRLLSAKADVVIPDFADSQRLFDFIMGKS